MRVLLVEDDERLADVLVRGLRDAGHELELCRTGLDGRGAVMHGSYDAVILDWMLPGVDGRTLCSEMRARGDATPVLMLTARQAVPDRISGLDAGADDYLTKPFAFEELLARLRVFDRRRGDQGRLIVGDLVIDPDRRTVQRGGEHVELTAREFDVLLVLAQRAGRVVTRFALFEAVWDGQTDLRSNAIDVHVGKLRAKVDRPFGRNSIQTVRGIGFRLSEHPAE
jgi:DNA-binding response OmpR family regulator